eukprot:3206561-Rhodomonas_salina.1
MSGLLVSAGTDAANVMVSEGYESAPLLLVRRSSLRTCLPVIVSEDDGRADSERYAPDFNTGLNSNRRRRKRGSGKTKAA